jgi:ferritin-like metal-binding protein YciE
MKTTKSPEKAKASSSGNEELRSKLGKLFEEGLKDIYWAEKALTKGIPKMIENATSEELVNALETHLTETA